MDSAAAFAEQRVGTTLNGKYRLEQLLGIGGMAAVYRGTHRNGNRVAVKVLHPDVSGQVELRDRFLREGYVANRVDHRGAVRVLDDDTAQDGSVFLVMELLEGETLDARWERAGRRLPHRVVAEWTDQLLDVLATAHEKGIVHRDIKPENLFLTRDGVLKVLDFGIARLRDATSSGAVSMTRTGHMLGTPAYMPPEQMLGRAREIDGQTDVWAVGATMFTLISGRFVHEAESVQEMIVYAGSRHARPISSVAPETPPELTAVIDRALAFEKGTRWPSALGMRQALQTACATCYGTAQLWGKPVDPPVFSATPPVVDEKKQVPDSDLSSTRTTLPMGTARTPAPTAQTASPAPSTSTTGGVQSRRGKGPGVRRYRGLQTAIAIGSAALVVVAVVTGVALRQRGRLTVGSGTPIAPQLPTSAAVEGPKGATSARSTIEQTPLAEGTATASAPATAVDAAATQVNRAPRPWLPPAVAPAGGEDDPHALERVLAGLRAAPSSAKALATAAGTKPNCEPPYTVDSAGRRIPKPECL
jgi:eukaryotic-like serine/threonine-protein kinase